MKDKTYIIICADGSKRKVTVPEDWKVTFGPACAGENKSTDHKFKMPMALRFYETKDKQRAIFTDVVSFRDSSIKIEEERIQTQEKHGFMECEGARKATTFQATTKEWVNPDEEVSTKLLMPSDSELFDKEEE